MKKFISDQQAESRAEERVREYEARFGRNITPPVPIEHMIDQIYDLRILWDSIHPENGLSPMAGIQPQERRIIINEDRRALFEKTPGLLNFTLGHELGHWDLHVNRSALNHPTFPGFEIASSIQHHQSSKGAVEVLVSRLHQAGLGKEEIYEIFREKVRGTDDFFEAHQVNRYASALLMPKWLILQEIEGKDLRSWPVLYRLRERFQVSISALKVRLETLGLIYVAEDKTIHRSKAEHRGQTSFL
jgi:Zn-dependent peptidase ImmA (M78 family)